MREREIDREQERLTSKTERYRQSQIVRETKRDTHTKRKRRREKMKKDEKKIKNVWKEVNCREG